MEKEVPLNALSESFDRPGNDEWRKALKTAMTHGHNDKATTFGHGSLVLTSLIQRRRKCFGERLRSQTCWSRSTIPRKSVARESPSPKCSVVFHRKLDKAIETRVAVRGVGQQDSPPQYRGSLTSCSVSTEPKRPSTTRSSNWQTWNWVNNDETKVRP